MAEQCDMSEPLETPLILICGLLCDRLIWDGVRAGLGRESTVHSFAGFDSLTAMATRLLDQAPSRFVLAGHSMGARVALEAWRLAPERVAGLALLNTGVHPVQAHEPAARGRLVELARQDGMRALADAWLPPMMGIEPPEEALMASLRAMVERQTPESFAGQIKALLDRPEAERILASVTVPTLLVAATRDRWSPVAQHQAMQALLPAATLVVIDGAGHMAPAEAPGAVATALREWIADGVA